MPSLYSGGLNESSLYSKEDASELASVLGLHLVTQVLEEACTIATASKRIGWPWKCIRLIYDDLQEGKETVTRCNVTEILQGDIEDSSEKIEANKLGATSTPHKGEISKKPDNILIGQGDEEMDWNEHKLSKSTLRFINYLFDMGEVEDDVSNKDDVENSKVEIENEQAAVDNVQAKVEFSHTDTKVVFQDNAIIYDIIEQLFCKVVESTSENEEPVLEDSESRRILNKIQEFKANSPYHPFFNVDGWETFTETAMISGMKQKISYFKEDEESDTEYDTYVSAEERISKPRSAIIMHEGVYSIQHAEAEGSTTANRTEHNQGDINDRLFTFEREPDKHIIFPEGSYNFQKTENDNTESEKNDVAKYEDAYVTLNRDYEQYSEEGEPILEDPKALTMQDVQLSAGSASEDGNTSEYDAEMEARKELAATSAVSGASGSRKSRTSLMSRCKTQGARLLSCLRGWWRRKTPGKRKDARATGSIKGVCPLSPEGRRRAASLLDNSSLYSPSARRSVVWKFNTVNEAIVNSSRWKDYTYEVKPEVCGEYC